MKTPFDLGIGDENTPKKTVHAQVAYEDKDGKVVVVPVQNEVPEAMTWCYWSFSMMEAAREIIEPTGAKYGMLRFRTDGTEDPLSIGERIADAWYRLTWRGKPVTASRFIPIWPRPGAAA